MDANVAARVRRLSDLGWEVTSQTDTTASLTTRTPFGWFWFAVWLLVFLGFGAIMYTIWWLATSKRHVFVSLEPDNSVSVSGDAFYVAHQEAQVEAFMRAHQEMVEKGFLKAAGPSIISFILVVAIWVFIIWLVARYL